MKELVPLLEKLASQLGTTIDKLWAVLLKQAMIIGITDLVLCVSLVGASILAFRFIQKKTTIPTETVENKYPHAQWEGEGAFIAWLIFFIGLLVTTIIILASAENIVSAFLNPEYWALNKILSHCSVR